ncbi:hypothetical protein VFPFJ_09545 [Purpureocillium lilacinum]|uniref:Uncharacterized protein n=1 Tax=Purpureocillium lilacinum TaxID=33203 RepID=A0A179GUU2_PURLI|nr:hypothetical protein VFPFJ_09545 [Purpureocillium lilacinum]OAQ81090.1 hypothetical protein VFPFJ_09545 [Purpureocillium lilacinum]
MKVMLSSTTTCLERRLGSTDCKDGTRDASVCSRGNASTTHLQPLLESLAPGALKDAVDGAVVGRPVPDALLLLAGLGGRRGTSDTAGRLGGQPPVRRRGLARGRHEQVLQRPMRWRRDEIGIRTPSGRSSLATGQRFDDDVSGIQSGIREARTSSRTTSAVFVG